MERVVDDGPLFSPEGDYFAQAQDLIDRALRAANDGAEIPPEFPSELLLRFNRLGRGLRDDEHIAWNREGRDDGPRHDRAVRKRLVLSRAPRYEQEVDLEGFVVGHEWPQASPGGTLLVALPAGNVKVAFGPELANHARRVMGNRDPFVRFVGTGVFDRTDRLQRVIETQVLDPIEPVDASREVAVDRLTNQLATIAALRDGWFDGDGTAFAPALLREVRDTMLALLDRGVSPPLMYPTPDGELRAEWSPSRPFYVSAAFDVAGQRVYLHSAPGLDEVEFDETELDVGDLDTIMAFLRAHGFAKEPLE